MKTVKFVETDIVVCNDCAEAIVTGDYAGFWNNPETAEQRINKLESTIEKHGELFLGESGFVSDTPCGCCGNENKGLRLKILKVEE